MRDANYVGAKSKRWLSIDGWIASDRIGVDRGGSMLIGGAMRISL